jgi:hypothetical protein
MPPPEAEMRVALATAPDAKLGRIVGMLDSLTDRGAADALLEAARPRLRSIRPARPLRFTRLLSLPVEPVLVAPEDWHARADRIPRHALAPIGNAMRDVLGDMAEDIEAEALGHTMANEALVAKLGRCLWPRAAVAKLPPLPPGWIAAGLPPSAAAAALVLCRRLWIAAAKAL